MLFENEKDNIDDVNELNISEDGSVNWEDVLADSDDLVSIKEEASKSNPDKTYADAIEAYYDLQNSKQKTTIGKQFQYNQYIRDFFEDNEDRSLDDAIKCWKYKKSLKGHNRYEKSDLVAL